MPKLLIILIYIGVCCFIAKIIKISHPTKSQELPTLNKLSYKATGRNAFGMTIYTIYADNGNATNVTEEQFKEVNIPQKVDCNLYKMPNGSYFTGGLKNARK
jgi:uncharacterized protein (UPF0333 family)